MGYLSVDVYRGMEQDGDELSQLINGYIGYLKRSKQGANEPGSYHVIHNSGESDLTPTGEPISGYITINQ